VLIAAALAAAVLAGVPWPVVALLALAHAAPWLALGVFAVVVTLAVRHRPPIASAADEASWLAALAAELRSGASLRTALSMVSSVVPALPTSGLARLAEAGAPVERIADEAAAVLPHRGRAVGAALSVAGAAGGRVAVVFERLAADAWADVESGRAMAALTVQARLSAWVVGGLPVVGLVILVVTGRLGAVLGSGSVAAFAMAVGVVLEVAGVAAVVAMVRRVGR
jgi:tight adherence protein B